jgi:hypothetical protein
MGGKEKMKYDVYHGTEKDFKESGGNRILHNVSKTTLKGYFKKNFESAFNGELIPFDHAEFGKGVLWIEEA